MFHCEERMVKEEDSTPDELWFNIKNSLLTAASKHIPKKRKRNTTSWLSQEAIDWTDEKKDFWRGSDEVKKI